MTHAIVPPMSPRVSTVANRYVLTLAAVHQDAGPVLESIRSAAGRWGRSHGRPRSSARQHPISAWSYIDVCRASDVQVQFLLPTGSWRLGRDADCDLYLNCVGISRQHLRIDVQPTRGVVLTDLGSTNGTRLDGELIVSAAVDGMAILDLGPLRLLLRPDD